MTTDTACRSPSLRRRALFRSLAAAAMILLPPGCGLILDPEPPPPSSRGRVLECFATVRNGGGREVVISSRLHPDFVERSTTPAGEERAEIRPYFTLADATSCPRAASVATAEADWRSWVRQRIEEIADDPTAPADPFEPGSSPFFLYDGPWCEVPDSVFCETRELLVETPPCGPTLPADVLGGCPLPPPPPGCLEIECGGTVPCTALDFGTVLVGASGSRRVELRNCGGTAAPEIPVTVDGAILPVPTSPRRDFVVRNNSCEPDTPLEIAAGEEILTNPLVDVANSSCGFDVFFEPRDPMGHAAEIVFRSPFDPRHTISLAGNAEGGNLVYTIPDLPVPSDIPAVLCVDALVGGCTRTRVIEVVNTGPGAVTITDIRLNRSAPGPPGWEIVSPAVPLPATGITLGVGDPPLQIRLRWCTDPEPDDQLIIVSNERGGGTFILDLTRMSTGSCPAGS